MTRHTFGGDLASWAFSTDDSGMVSVAGDVAITFWSDAAGGTQYTDLLLNGAPADAIVSGDGTTGPTGTIPQFQGPDDVWAMWASAGGGPRQIMLATDIPDTVKSNADALASLLAQSEALPNVNVKGSGALGNGITDDTAAIQAAIDSAGDGGCVYFPAGTYLISRPIRLYNRATYFGAGSQNTVVKQADNANLTYLVAWPRVGPGRTNLISNPSFEMNVNGWQANSNCMISRSSAWCQYGTYSMAVTPQSAGTMQVMIPGEISIVGGGQYTFSIFGRAAAASVQINPQITWYDAGNNVISTSSVAAAGPYATSASTARAILSATAPTLATSCQITINTAGSTGSADVLYLDAALLEQAATAGTYFDGDTIGFQWSGARHASTSTSILSPTTAGPTGCLVADLTIDGNATHNTAVTTYGLYADAMQYSVLRNVRVQNVNGDGYRFDGVGGGSFSQTTSTVHLVNCWAYGCVNSGLVGTSGVADLHLFGGDYGANGAAAVNLQSGSGTITGATLWGSTNGPGLVVGGPSNQIRGCNVEGNAQQGIVVNQYGDWTLISGNKVYANSYTQANSGLYDGIHVDGVAGDPVNGVLLLGNFIYANITAGGTTQRSAITFGNYHTNAVIDGNVVGFAGSGGTWAPDASLIQGVLGGDTVGFNPGWANAPAPTSEPQTGLTKLSFAQPAASTTWTLTHNLGTVPYVTVTDNSGNQLIPEVTYPDLNTVMLIFGSPQAGSAYVLG